LALLRIFGFGYSKFEFNQTKNLIIKDSISHKQEPLDPGLFNNFIQIGTGEGKSVTLAITSFILCLLGYQVSIACYSDVLSKRDESSFKGMTELLGFEK
jgi:hypothetical protein